MTQGYRISRAKMAAKSPVYVASDQQLRAAADDWKNSDIVAIDTEFVRERTYFARLGLLQVSDGETVWLVDPLTVQSFQPLIELLTDPAVIKLFHSPSEDYEVLKHTIGQLPAPVFDTQLAAAVLDQPLQISYLKLLQWQLGIEIEKGETRSNWLQRPLSERQKHYAALDVCYLPLIYQQLRDRLQDSNRVSWVEEDSLRQVEKNRQQDNPLSLLRKFRNAWRLDPRQLGVLCDLLLWREQTAIDRDLPRSFVLRDNDLMAIATALPETRQDLDRTGDIHPAARQRYGGEILAISRNKSNQNLAGAAGFILKPLTGAEKKCLQKCREQIARTAADLAVDSGLLASKKELEQLLRQRPVEPVGERYRGWREPYLSPIIERINQLPRNSE